jgi:hypothetical protein
MKDFQRNWGLVFLLAGAAALLLPAGLPAQPPVLEESVRAAPTDVVKGYLQATRARDAATAYRRISSVDRTARDEKTYIRSQENFTGFALDLARRLAADMEVWIIEQKLGAAKARLEVGYRVPTGDDISHQLLDWNAEKLNSLSVSEQAALVAAWEKVKKSGKAVAIEGRETFDLVRQSDGWKIFLDWRSRHRVVFKTSRQTPAHVAVKFLRNDLLVKNEDPFQIDVRVTNRTDRDLVVKLSHLFSPRHIEKNVDMIVCGSLAPLRLRSHETQQISSAYLLRGNIALNTPVEIIYDFTLAPMPGNRRFSQASAEVIPR